jgi:hypothetical protein
LDFSDRREKKLNAIRFSRARARVSKLRVGTVYILVSSEYTVMRVSFFSRQIAINVLILI